MPMVRKTKAGGPGPPAAQVLPRSVSLSAQGLPAALHQNSCDAQTNGGPTCERKERDPHGVPRSVRPSFCCRLRFDRSLERAVNAEAGHPFRELCFLI